MNGSESGISRWPIEGMRVYTGVFFLLHGGGKVFRDDKFDITGFLQKYTDGAFDFYRPLIDSVFIPNAGVFSFLVAYGEVALGLALIIGLATRYAAFAGAFMTINFWFAKGQPYDGSDVIWTVILLVLALVPAGKVLGLDQILSKRFAFLR